MSQVSVYRTNDPIVSFVAVIVSIVHDSIYRVLMNKLSVSFLEASVAKINTQTKGTLVFGLTSSALPIRLLTRLRRMDFPIIIIWVGPLSLFGASGVILNSFISFFDEILLSKQNSPGWDAALCGIPSGAMLFVYVL